MKGFNIFALTTGLAVMSGSANAVSINFNALAESGGGIGESAWSALMFDVNGNHTTNAGNAFLTITGTNGGNSYAYLDAANAGLGVCGTLGAGAASNQVTNSGANLCNPSSDDNISHHNGTPETLHFVFAADVVIDKIWLNNNHDGDRSLLNDYVAIDGAATQLLQVIRNYIVGIRIIVIFLISLYLLRSALRVSDCAAGFSPQSPVVPVHTGLRYAQYQVYPDNVLFHFSIHINAFNFFIMLKIVNNFTAGITRQAIGADELVNFDRYRFLSRLVFFTFVQFTITRCFLFGGLFRL